MKFAEVPFTSRIIRTFKAVWRIRRLAPSRPKARSLSALCSFETKAPFWGAYYPRRARVDTFYFVKALGFNQRYHDELASGHFIALELPLCSREGTASGTVLEAEISYKTSTWTVSRFRCLRTFEAQCEDFWHTRLIDDSC